MRLLRAGHAVARRLNCGVMRHRTLTAIVLAMGLAFLPSMLPIESAFSQEQRTYEYFGVVLEVPEGYVGPVTMDSGIAFTIPGTVGVPAPTFSIQRFDTGRDIPEGTDDEEYPFLIGQVNRMLDSVRRTRANYNASSPERIRIGGVRVARASWTGDAQGQPMNGLVYSFFSGTAIVFALIQGPGHTLDEKLERAVAAIEGAQVTR
jgi:hypothetical protein